MDIVNVLKLCIVCLFQFQLVLVYLLIFGSLTRVLELKMDAMLPFLSPFPVIAVRESSLKFLSFLCNYIYTY